MVMSSPIRQRSSPTFKASAPNLRQGRPVSVVVSPAGSDTLTKAKGTGKGSFGKSAGHYFSHGLGLVGALLAIPAGYRYRQPLAAALGKAATRLADVFPLPGWLERTPPPPPAEQIAQAAKSVWMTGQTLAKAGVSVLLGGGLLGGIVLLGKKADVQNNGQGIRQEFPEYRPVQWFQNFLKTGEARQIELLNNLEIPYPIAMKSNRAEANRPGLNVVEALSHLRRARTVALGDLHGSYPKLIETLALADMITMPPVVATRFKNLANDPRNFSNNMDELNAIYTELEQIIPQIQWKGNGQLILIGDVLSDRGSCDLFTLKIIEHLTRDGHGDRFIRIASNHDHNVLFNLIYDMDSLAPSDSINRARNLAESLGPDAETNLKQMFKDYLSQSKLMHYNPESQTLYTHAPITNQNLRDLIRIMKTKDASVPDFENINTSAEVSRFADQANRFYHDYVIDCFKKNRLNQEIENVLAKNSAFLWNRIPVQQESELPLQGKNVIRLIHGHDARTLNFTPIQYNVVNLDQDIHKYDNPGTQPQIREQFVEEHRDSSLLNPNYPSPLYVEF